MNNIDKFRHDTIMAFYNDTELYTIPFGYRMYAGIDLYVSALDDVDDYNNSILTLDDIFHDPTNHLRNIIKLWHIDKLNFELKQTIIKH